MISIIAAVSQNGVIGNNNQLPWRLPDELRYFKEKTLHKPIIMGRKTFESLAKPLPNRRNMVISSQLLATSGIEVFGGLTKAIDACADAEEIMIIGGATLYQAALPMADKLYLTVVDCEIEGDTAFPDWNERAWQLVSCQAHPKDANHAYAFETREYVRRH